MHKKKSNEPTPKGRRANVKPDNGTCASKKRFFNFLAVTGKIWTSARKARVPPSRIAKWRKEDSEFEAEIQKTLQLCREKELEMLETETVRRATEGRSRPIYHYDRKQGRAVKIDEEKIPSDLLMIARLRRLDPRYASNKIVDVNVPAPTSTFIVLPDSRVTEPTRQGNSNVILVPPQSPKSSQTADVEILQRQWKQELQDRKQQLQDNNSTNNVAVASDESQKPPERFELVDSAARNKPNGKGE